MYVLLLFILYIFIESLMMDKISKALNYCQWKDDNILMYTFIKEFMFTSFLLTHAEVQSLNSVSGLAPNAFIISTT